MKAHPDILDAKGLPLLCLGANGCHRYLPEAERRLTAAVEALMASPRVIINYCNHGGNHTDLNPPKRGKGKQVRQGGRGRGGVAEFYTRRSDNAACLFFQMGTCIHTKEGAQCKKEHIGDPSRIRCTLPLVGDHCRNGKGCLFNHGSEGAGSSTAHK